MATRRTGSAFGGAATAIAIASLLLSGCSATASSSGAASQGPAARGADLITQRCTRCHPVERIDAASHDRAGWDTTIARMRNKGAELTDAEAAILADYLANR